MNTTTRPAALTTLADERIVELDLRPVFARGEKPCNLIQETRERVPEGGALCLRVPFEPVPLYGVMAGHGLTHETRRDRDGHFEVWFWDAGDLPERADDSSCGCGCGGAKERPAEAHHQATIPTYADGTPVLDVRGLEPPEPMRRTLAALEELGPGDSLIQLIDRVPRLLLPIFEGQNISWELLESDPSGVRARITLPGGGESQGDDELRAGIMRRSRPGCGWPLRRSAYVRKEEHVVLPYMLRRPLAFEPVFPKKTNNSSGLQFADLIAHPIGRHVLAPSQENRAWTIVREELRRTPRPGSPRGWGLKVFP